MEFDQEQMVVRFDMVKLRSFQTTSYVLTFVITDNLDASSEVKWSVKIENPVVFVFTPAIEAIVVEEEVVEELTTDMLSAFIVSISSQGEMLVRFNATVQNNLNLTFL